MLVQQLLWIKLQSDAWQRPLRLDITVAVPI